MAYNVDMDRRTIPNVDEDEKFPEDLNTMSELAKSGVSYTLAKGAAWSLPAVAVAAAAPPLPPASPSRKPASKAG